MKDIARRLLQLAKEKQYNNYGYDHRLDGLQEAYVHMMIGEACCRTWEDIANNLQDWFFDNTKFSQDCSSYYKAVALLKKYIKEHSPNIMATE